MKAALGIIFIFLGSLAFAQSQSPSSVPQACGPQQAQFETQIAKGQPTSEPDASKSTVYVIEVFDKAAGELSHPTLRVGLDGKWVGANKGNSYFSFTTDPGEHHLCANWQSHWKRLSKEAAFTGFTADAGKTYYFRARITEVGAQGQASNFSLDLDPLNVDEGRYLVASSGLSISHQKQ